MHNFINLSPNLSIQIQLFENTSIIIYNFNIGIEIYKEIQFLNLKLITNLKAKAIINDFSI